MEGVDATLRSLKCVLDAHDELKAKDPQIGEEYGRIMNNTTEALKHRVELLQSTRLRLSSVDKRLQNIINLVRAATYNFKLSVPRMPRRPHLLYARYLSFKLLKPIIPNYIFRPSICRLLMIVR